LHQNPQKRITIRPGRIQIEIALFVPENTENKEDNETREDRIATKILPLRTASVCRRKI